MRIESDSESEEDSTPELVERKLPSICYSSSSSEDEEEEDSMPELVSRDHEKKTNETTKEIAKGTKETKKIPEWIMAGNL